ncbi:Ras subfamily protein [Acanthamoeba castellanii str. Neff]|uniref:Ras subfamily protein n=1 Tax=Acanthamoeba castellanii (strain ATCC 30010 / Neff) TaxID=1257118 RepID=L8HEW7_ACACF|nr:Ras subfamily protein [Acanthamoeba castellanii str. Neff]ELR22951.1 Ras subfamily protein [Acanthamoeba castellanii str. Neff]
MMDALTQAATYGDPDDEDEDWEDVSLGLFRGNSADTFGFMEGDVLLEGERVRLKVIHNGGDNCIDARLAEEMKNCDIVILLFDIANKPTMEKLKTKWYPLVRSWNGSAPLVLIGNKRDLRADKTDHVQTAEGEAAAVALGDIPYIETSLAHDTWDEETTTLWQACVQLYKRTPTKKSE